MKLARYVGEGRIEIRDEPEPALPRGGLIVKTEASGLCSGELMDWYMERKVPHVLGHEVSGIVVESDDPRFPVGCRVAPHHHAACGHCDWCRSGRPVHCEQWKRTKLVPGGMAEFFAVAAENLADTHRADDLRPQEAALMEPLGCVAKSIRLAAIRPEESVAVIGLGTMGLMHALAAESQVKALEIYPGRRDWAAQFGIEVYSELNERLDVVILCPGVRPAYETAFRLAAPGGRIVLFAPFAPGADVPMDWDRLYFEEITLIPSYSCGPEDTVQALKWLKAGVVKAEQVVSHFLGIDDLPQAYLAMKRGEILKAMVMFE